MGVTHTGTTDGDAPGADRDYLRFAEVFRHELQQLGRQRVVRVADGAAGSSGAKDTDAERLRRLFRAVGQLSPDAAGNDADDERPLSALCLSGGGIRSATFNLGVLQALARIGILDQFDYLSSVSGGGYIAGWLKAWMRRDGTAKVVDQLAHPFDPASSDPLAPEPRPIAQLRQYSNYLTPRLGLFSPDTWMAGAIILRNLILNWLVIVPLLAAAVAVPQLALVVAGEDRHAKAGAFFALFAVLAELIASWNIHHYRTRSLEQGARGAGDDDRPPSESRIVLHSVVPLYLAAVLLSQAGLSMPWATVPGWSLFAAVQPWGFASVWCLVIPFVGWVFHVPRGRWLAEFTALVVSGGVAAGMLVLLANAAAPWLVGHPALYVIFALPMLLGDYLLARTLFVAIASRADTPPANVGGARAARAACPPAEPQVDQPDPLERADHDREWWARLSGWVLALALTWLAVAALCALGVYGFEQFRTHYAGTIITALGGIAGITAALLGGSGPSKSGRGASGDSPSPVRRIALAASAPIFCVLLIVLVARGNTLAGRLATGDSDLLCIPPDFARWTPCDSTTARRTSPVSPTPAPTPTSSPRALPALLGRAGVSDPDLQRALAFLVVPLGLIAVSGLAGTVVNPNRFSLHGFYRNRLVRAYLGASHVRRSADLFTGFAVDDNLHLHELWHPAGEPGGDARTDPAECTRPLPIINTALNLVSGETLAWQQRKAESFAMTPFHCGNFREGYRPSRCYGGPDGITLGTAMTISGAAANPNMGYHSSPLITFLMTLFNARLGAWLGNTNAEGGDTYTQPGPRWAVPPIFNELFGRTTNRQPYVNLSDGGHFENLGLYEVVLRRCRHVVVSDAGHDPACGFEDLGNAIRKIRIDLGVDVTFRDQIAIRPRTASEPGLYCAIGEIDYAAVDGEGTTPGWLLYLKPGLNGELTPVPYDVYSYAQQSKEFPHETTNDQWFDESQFESYRVLGEHIMRRVAYGDGRAHGRGGTLESLPALRDAAVAYVRLRAAARRGPPHARGPRRIRGSLIAPAVGCPSAGCEVAPGVGD